MAGFSLFAQSRTAIATARRDVIPLMVSGASSPLSSGSTLFPKQVQPCAI
jgi:hypothetical protein